jgi:hypothetical protein
METLVKWDHYLHVFVSVTKSETMASTRENKHKRDRWQESTISKQAPNI